MGPITDHSGCQSHVGYVVDLDGGAANARVFLDIRPRHLNRQSLLHGGLAAMLLDAVSGYVAGGYFTGDGKGHVLTVSLTTQFIAPVDRGRVVATARTRGGGRSIVHVDGQLRDHRDRLVATSAGVFKQVRGERSEREPLA